jgi:tetraacyldisaccharide 4'-kinase
MPTTMEQFAREVMSGQKRGFAANLLYAGLWLAQWPYRVGVACKNAAFDFGLREPFEVGVPVISVGNLTTGGTGKTPVVAFLANWFRDAGVKVGLLSRGYKSLDAEANDEKLVLDQLCPGVPHWLNPDRIDSAKRALAEAGCELLILDDAFQHRRLHRDLDIVLIDAMCPWGYGHCLPCGLLREPVSAIERADLVLITRAELVSAEDLTAIRTVLVRHDHVGSVVELAFRPTVLINSAGATRSLSDIAGARAVAFCGLGNPTAFEQTLQRLGINVVGFHAFPDHHHYAAGDWERLTSRPEMCDADLVLTTLKDLVKIRATELCGRPLWAVQIGTDVVRGAPLLEHRLFKLLDEIQS